MQRIYKLCAMCACLVVGLAGSAAALEKAEGKVILSISGSIAETNSGDRADFDLRMLEALNGRMARVETPWTAGTVEFSGPLFRSVLEKVGSTGSKLVIRALNDYSVEIPVSDAMDIKSILATQMNGEPIPVREKGPLFLIYPFDLDASLYNEKYFSRSVWQIRSIEVLP